MTVGRRSGTWTCGEHRLPIGDRTLVMGILNVTPDSFSDGGRFLNRDAAIARALEMVAQGADILDIGGESTRPGAEAVPAAEELARIMPVLEALRERADIVLSVDTMKAPVARAALKAGASIVNDVSACRADPDMPAVVADSGAGLVLMHMQGVPRTMQEKPSYADAAAEVREFLRNRAAACAAAGVGKGRIAVDPGIGFGKLDGHNARLLARLDGLADLGFPVVVGVSRKSFIGRTLARDVGDRLAGSLAAAAYAILRGAHIIRVHDVKESCDLCRMIDMLWAQEQGDVGAESDTHT